MYRNRHSLYQRWLILQALKAQEARQAALADRMRRAA